jgi:hypothetical protein
MNAKYAVTDDLTTFEALGAFCKLIGSALRAGELTQFQWEELQDQASAQVNAAIKGKYLGSSQSIKRDEVYCELGHRSTYKGVKKTVPDNFRGSLHEV